MSNPFRSKPQRPFDPHQFERLRDFLEDNHIDWETYLRSLLVDGRAPAPFIYGPTSTSTGRTYRLFATISRLKACGAWRS